MARACGLKTYYNDKPCSRGNVADRWTSNCGCTCQPCKDARSALTRVRYFQKWDEIKEKRVENYRTRASEYCDSNRQRRRANPNVRAREIDNCRAWRKRNPGRLAELARLHKAADPDRYRAVARFRHSLQPHIAKEKARRREVAKSHRSPYWNPELDRFVMQECYHLAALREQATGVRWEVDHLLPLRGKTVSGLHCAGNLQVIPSYLNRLKANHVVMTQPFEWISYVGLGASDTMILKYLMEFSE